MTSHSIGALSGGYVTAQVWWSAKSVMSTCRQWIYWCNLAVNVTAVRTIIRHLTAVTVCVLCPSSMHYTLFFLCNLEFDLLITDAHEWYLLCLPFENWRRLKHWFRRSSQEHVHYFNSTVLKRSNRQKPSVTMTSYEISIDGNNWVCSRHRSQVAFFTSGPGQGPINILI